MRKQKDLEITDSSKEERMIGNIMRRRNRDFGFVSLPIRIPKHIHISSILRTNSLKKKP